MTSISAVTLVTSDMAASVEFYETLGLRIRYGGRDDPFTSLHVGDGYLNVQLDERWSRPTIVWGRVILYVDDVDDMYQRAIDAGLSPATEPEDAPWHERYFHIRDPAGHEVSFARPIT